MEMLRDMFPTRSEKELKEVLGEASQDCDRAVEMLLARPAAKPPPRPRPLQNLSKRASNVIEAPPLTPATASAISFGNMSLSEDLSRRKEPTTPRRKIIAISSDEAEPERDRESETVSHILAIFPDACPETTRKLYQEHQVLQGSNIAEFLANKYAEGGYIKAEKAGQKRKRQVSEEDEDDARKKTTYDPEGRPPVTAEYRKLA